MTTNNEIYVSAITLLNTAVLGYPISYPGYNFEPPSTGAWLEVEFFPNEGLDNGLRYADTVIPQGIFQVSVVTRPGGGIATLYSIADQLRLLYAKGTALVDTVRVTRQPYDMELTAGSDRMMFVVTVEYSG